MKFRILNKKIVLKDVKTFNTLTGYRSVPPDETVTNNEGLLNLIKLKKITQLPLNETFGLPLYKIEKDGTKASNFFNKEYSKRTLSKRSSLYTKPPDINVSFGKGLNASQAKASAIMELLERNLSYKKKDVFYARYNEVADRAIPLSKLQIPDSLKYIYNEGSELTLSSKIKIEWCWCYSLVHQESFLVPAHLVFWPYQDLRNDKMSFFQTTNGLASGNTIEEAILHGIFENVERDAHQTSVVEKTIKFKELSLIDVRDYCNENFPKPFNQDLASNIIVFDTKNPNFDLGIYTMVAGILWYEDRSKLKHARSISLNILRGKKSVSLSCGRGSNLNPRIACARALSELVELKHRRFTEDTKFFTGVSNLQVSKKSLDELPNYSNENIKKDIEKCIGSFRKNNLDILVADLTPKNLNLSLVRVITPGLKHQDFSSRPIRLEIE